MKSNKSVLGIIFLSLILSYYPVKSIHNSTKKIPLNNRKIASIKTNSNLNLKQEQPIDLTLDKSFDLKRIKEIQTSLFKTSDKVIKIDLSKTCKKKVIQNIEKEIKTKTNDSQKVIALLQQLIDKQDQKKSIKESAAFSSNQLIQTLLSQQIMLTNMMNSQMLNNSRYSNYIRDPYNNNNPYSLSAYNFSKNLTLGLHNNPYNYDPLYYSKEFNSNALYGSPLRDFNRIPNSTSNNALQNNSLNVWQTESLQNPFSKSDYYRLQHLNISQNKFVLESYKASKQIVNEGGFNF